MPVRRAVLSVSDKSGLVEFARGLVELGVAILSTGGTAARLREGGLAVTDVGEYTGAGEMLDGRVKTLHPRIHAGILARRDRPDDLATLAKAGIEPIDLVVVNLYPFAAKIREVGGRIERALEEIDVGGPTMVRAAAKNYPSVAVLVDPADYGRVLDELRRAGAVAESTRRELAGKAFAHTAEYDRLIADSFQEFPERMGDRFTRRRELRYGENPHQRAALYVDDLHGGASLALAETREGKELSYNNYLDLDAALRTAREFDRPAAVVIKHATPCGVALGLDLAEAFERAWTTDPMSAFGSVVGFNRAVDEGAAAKVAEIGTFVEAIVAPHFEPGAARVLAEKPKWGKSVRLVEVPGLTEPRTGFAVRGITGGLLVQDPDLALWNEPELEVVAGDAPDPATRADLEFAFRVVKHVASNAIVLASGGAAVGIGGGQVSRVDSVETAISKAGPRARGSVLASDAFFPFRDSIDRAAAAGIRAIVQPGGSRRDDEVIAAAREHGLVMVLTRMRHFRH